MFKILITLAIALSFNTVNAEQLIKHRFSVTRIIDGDTVAFEAKFLPAPLKPELLLRIYGVDTPEKGRRAQCPQEDEMSQRAKKFTEQVIMNAKTKSIIIIEWDKYGGRVLGDILLDGKSLRSMLIEKGYARKYFGEAKKSWCS